jgi:hypothetical protein
MFVLVSLLSAIAAAQLVGIVLLLAGASKLINRTDAVRAVEAYGILPRALAQFVGRALPPFELLIAACLLSGFLVGLAMPAALLLLLLFSVAQTIVLARGQEVPCGCFGSSSLDPVRWMNVIRNIALATCCGLVMHGVPIRVDLEWFPTLITRASGSRVSVSEVVVLQILTIGLAVEYMIIRQIGRNDQLQREFEDYQHRVANVLAIQGELATANT